MDLKRETKQSLYVATLLRAEANDKDTVGRFGGDEFGVILPNHSVERATFFTEDVRQQAQATEISGLSEPITLSLGVATFPVHARSKEDLLLMADETLYQAKESGRNCVCIAR
jgi:diguanylate cyclase (GGDEF)-like protein